jgi:hypothetical protein
MIEFDRAWDNQVEQGAKRAAVCSRPPSEVGVGIVLDVVVVVRDVGEDNGRK